ncbi:MAG: protein kinase [Labilithrix sp.]|nr:protein kinase [Labilithrix sp.]
MSQGQDHASERGPASGDGSRGDPALINRTVAGKFVIEKFLGGGAMGAVYRARQTALEKNVALKVMHRAIAVDPSFVARFHREAKAASRLDHPSSMRVIDFGEEPDGLLYIAMEYLDGRDLFRVIHEDWPLSNQRIGDILMQALAAIAVAHDMGVIHRDLKPENIMILRTKDDDGRDGADLVKVCDFGIAKIQESDDAPRPAGPAGQKLTTQGLVVGTPEYMSPEQARGEKLDARSDLYAMAVILYQLLTGRTPFTADTPLAVVLKHITENPQPPREIYAGVHPGLEEVAMKGMAKDRDARYQTARDMRNAIRATLEGRPAPVDIAAATEASLPSLGGAAPGTAPVVVSAQAIAPSRDFVASAPTVGGVPSAASTLTPLGAPTIAEPAKRSRAGLFIGVGAAIVLLGAGAFAARSFLASGTTFDVKPATPADRSAAIPPSTSAPPSAPPASSEAPKEAASTVAPEASIAVPADPKKPAVAKPSTAKPAETHVETAPPPPEPVTVKVEPTPPPPTPQPAPQPPPPAAQPAPPPPFNPATCKATVGAPKAATAISARNLRLNAAPASFNACAKSAIREKPPGPIATTVRIMFSDTKAFKGATCNGCPAALAGCVAQGARGASVVLNDDAIDSAFDVPVTFSCD